MLIKKSIVEQWYQTDSWVFKNFSYLFENPLWSKSVPRGFSVCPYFWLSLFSLFIFKPFCSFITLITPLAKLGGKPFIAFDIFWDRVFARIFKIEGEFRRGPSIIPSLLIFLISFVGLVVGSTIIVNLQKFWNYAQISHDVYVLFWICLGGLITISAIFIHWLTNRLCKRYESRCKTEAYIYLYTLLAVISLGIFCPHSFAHIFIILGQSLAIAGANVWQYLGYVFVDIIYGIKIGGYYVGWALWKALIFHGTLYFFVALIVMALIGYLSDKTISFLDFREKKREEREIKTLSKKELKQRRYDAWEYILCEISSNYSYLVESVASQYKAYAAESRFDRKAIDYLDKSITKEVGKLYWKPFITKLSTLDYNPSIGELLNKFKKIENFAHRLMILNTEIMKVAPKEGYFIHCSDYGFYSLTEKVVEKGTFKQSIKDLAESYEHADKLKEQQQIAKDNSWLHTTCIKMTTAITGKFRSFFISIWKIISKIGKGIWWFCCQVGILFVYLWMLIKAKKQGACPYFTFSDKK